MSNELDLKPVFDFLNGLQKNNNRIWFEKNRSDYENAKATFESFVDELIVGFGKIEDLKGVTAKDCIMRIYRDVRFSKDKSPYRTNMGAMIASGGKKSARLGYYLHLAPHNESMMAGGLYQAETGQLNKFRSAIDRNAQPFKAIINDKKFRQYFGTLDGEKLKTAPQGYDRDHPEIELLRLKQIVAIHHVSDEKVFSPRFSAHVLDTFTVMKPFLDYLNSVII